MLENSEIPLLTPSSLLKTFPQLLKDGETKFINFFSLSCLYRDFLFFYFFALGNPKEGELQNPADFSLLLLRFFQAILKRNGILLMHEERFFNKNSKAMKEMRKMEKKKKRKMKIGWGEIWNFTDFFSSYIWFHLLTRMRIKTQIVDEKSVEMKF